MNLNKNYYKLSVKAMNLLAKNLSQTVKKSSAVKKSLAMKKSSAVKKSLKKRVTSKRRSWVKSDTKYEVKSSLKKLKRIVAQKKVLEKI